MKTFLKNLFLLPALIAGLSLLPAGRATAQTFTTLHSFTGASGGANPSGVILSGNTLYGTAGGGPDLNFGRVFRLDTVGTGFTNLSYTSKYPSAVILSGNKLYGTSGGNLGSDNGKVFVVNIDGTGFTNLHSFTGFSDGANPQAGVVLSGNTLYGTTSEGGSSDRGTVFAVNTDGTGFINLHNFTGSSDGTYPAAGLIVSGGILYGTASQGGSAGYGTVFALNTNGTGFMNLHSFTYNDGAHPAAGLILSGSTLYGTTGEGGSSGNGGNGTVFKLNTDGLGFTTLHHFTATPEPFLVNSDGANPAADLTLSGNTLFGTALGGGSEGFGTVFSVNITGTGFANLHSFTGSDGISPAAKLILSDNILYGTTVNGGSSGAGTVFSLSLPPLPPLPPLTITQAGANVILTWPAAATGWTLQSAPSLAAPVVWGTVVPAPVILNGLHTVTTPISGTRKFFRLSQ